MQKLKKIFKYSFYSIFIITILYIFNLFLFEYMILDNKDKIYENYPLDKEIDITKKLKKSDDDILIIFDDFNSYHENKFYFHEIYTHGERVSKKFLEYYFKYVKENNGKSIQLILLSQIYQNSQSQIKNYDYNNDGKKYKEIEYMLREMNCVKLIEPKKYEINIPNEYSEENIGFKKNITETCHSLDNYLKMIRELNPNSKIVLSMSFFKEKQYLYLKELGKKYNIQYAQAYFNNFDKILSKFFYLYNYLFTSQIEPLYVTNTKHKPLLYDKQVSIKDLNLKLEEKYYDENDYSNSYLTPILAYEYYLNDSKNILKTK